MKMRTGLVLTTLVAGLMTALLVFAAHAIAQGKSEKTFNALITDTQGIETEIKNVSFYWEEKISETAFVPHELRQLPVKRGTATVQVKFDTIKQLDVKQNPDKGLPTFAITLTNGKSGEFTAALAGSFRGESDFGQTEIPISTITKVIFK
ncbi:MAG: hypothetical protein M3Z35_05705 [Nitrospirota bacterium]|nr:hypothetical protein [Nitrospirota bacterium]